jgi:hypothetical protein
MGDRFVGTRGISCEGDGEIIVSQGGSTVRCVVGYVTPGAVQDFSFVVENGSCQTA